MALRDINREDTLRIIITPEDVMPKTTVVPASNEAKTKPLVQQFTQDGVPIPTIDKTHPGEAPVLLVIARKAVGIALDIKQVSLKRSN